MKRQRYRMPRNAAERIAEARAAIARLTATMNQGDNRFGEYGRNCREAIARWQAVIDREEQAGVTPKPDPHSGPASS